MQTHQDPKPQVKRQEDGDPRASSEKRAAAHFKRAIVNWVEGDPHTDDLIAVLAVIEALRSARREGRLP